MKLSGRNTLITGGSQGFGRHLVEAFLAAGANVIFCARTAADVSTTQAANVAISKVDVRDAITDDFPKFSRFHEQTEIGTLANVPKMKNSK